MPPHRARQAAASGEVHLLLVEGGGDVSARKLKPAPLKVVLVPLPAPPDPATADRILDALARLLDNLMARKPV